MCIVRSLPHTESVIHIHTHIFKRLYVCLPELAVEIARCGHGLGNYYMNIQI